MTDDTPQKPQLFILRSPDILPDGYEPPTSSVELLERSNAGERFFEDAQLEGAALEGENLPEINLRYADLRGAKLFEARLDGANLSQAKLQKADLRKSCLERANLHKADLDGARLDGASLEGVDLSKANLRRASLRDCAAFLVAESTNLEGAVVDFDTLKTSGFTPQDLDLLLEKQAVVSGLDAFPRVLLDQIGSSQGLTIFFNTSLTPVDRFLIDGVIFGVLGLDTNCKVVGFREEGDKAIVRLQAEHSEDLEAVADALYQRIWEAQEKAQEAAILRLDSVLQLQKIAPALTELADKVDRVELREDILEMLGDQAEAHIQKKDAKTTRTAGQTVLRAVWEHGKKKVGEELGDLVEEGVKRLLDEGDDEDDS